MSSADSSSSQSKKSPSHSSQVARSQRLESLGQLSGKVAHDVNNFLGVIRGHLQLLERLQNDPIRHQNSIDMALEACEHSSALLRRVLDYGSPVSPERSVLSARALIERAVEFARVILSPQIVISVEYSSNEQCIEVNASEMLQVFTNLFLNAQYEMSGGGTLTIYVEELSLASISAARPWARPGKYIAIRVKDSGRGISPQDLSKIFEPYYTTKPDGAGTGLGLSAADSIVRAHGGWMEASSSADSGAILSVVLPTVQNNDSAPKAATR